MIHEVLSHSITAIVSIAGALVMQRGLTRRTEIEHDATLAHDVIQPLLARIATLEANDAECRDRAEKLASELAEVRAELRITLARVAEINARPMPSLKRIDQ